MSSIIKYLVSHTMLSSIMWNVWRCGLSLQVYGCFLAVFLLLIFNSIACGQRVWSVLCSWYHIFGSISGAAGDLCSFFRALPSTGFHSIPITHSSSNRLALVYGGLPWAACHAVLSRTVMSDSLRPRGLQPTRLLCSLGFSRQEYWSRLPCPPPRRGSGPCAKTALPTLGWLWESPEVLLKHTDFQVAAPSP